MQKAGAEVFRQQLLARFAESLDALDRSQLYIPSRIVWVRRTPSASLKLMGLIVLLHPPEEPRIQQYQDQLAATLRRIGILLNDKYKRAFPASPGVRERAPEGARRGRLATGRCRHDVASARAASPERSCGGRRVPGPHRKVTTRPRTTNQTKESAARPRKRAIQQTKARSFVGVRRTG